MGFGEGDSRASRAQWRIIANLSSLPDFAAGHWPLSRRFAAL
jgi:hypothetical protein